MDSIFASKGFKASKCKTLLKLTIPRIKLLRNRREIQIKQMRREIAKLLETGQEATARIRVEHIIREEKMMAAQEIIELFCELIVVRLPIIEAQRECPLDLKEAISSVCFAAPRCADLQELQQVHVLFAGKYGKEFVAAATELMPECGVNRQLIELLSIRAPAPDVKLKLLKEIAEEHKVDWDPSASETELLKPHEDLLNGPTQFVSGSKVSIPEEKVDESSHGASLSGKDLGGQSDSDADYDIIDLPEVPKQPLRSNTGDVTALEMLPFPASALSDGENESVEPSGNDEGHPKEPHLKSEVLKDDLAQELQKPIHSSQTVEEKQFVPFILPPSQSSASISARQNNPPPTISRNKSDANADLQDVLAAAQAAAETAEQAAAAARSAATLAKMRISELAKRRNDEVTDGGRNENPCHVETQTPDLPAKTQMGSQSSLTDSVPDLGSPNFHYKSNTHAASPVTDIPSYDGAHSPQSTIHMIGPGAANHHFQRLPSMDEEASYFSYPNLFTSQGSAPPSHSNSFTDNSLSKHDQ